jgi:hypothetical protein
MYTAAEVKLGLVSLDAWFHMCMVWQALYEWRGEKLDTENKGIRQKNWCIVPGVHIAALYSFIFSNGLDHLIERISVVKECWPCSSAASSMLRES